VRISGNVRVGNAGGRGTSRNGSSGAAFHVDEGPAAPRAAATAATTPSAGIDALLALQAAQDPLLNRRKLVRRGNALLDTLQEVAADVLVGRVSDGRLNQLLALIGQARERGEPELDALLDDIELRARVELAKRGLFPRL
jgi:parvulin-like peptidyl-prolyl isomerase